MDLQYKPELASGYKAASQIARVLSEDWCSRELYCPACDSNRLVQSKANTPAVDFVCPQCGQPFQLKSLRSWNPRKIPDAGYEAMIRAIQNDKTPNLLVLQYSRDWFVRNVMLVPHFFFSETIIEKRKPLGGHARRAGWIGCNILLGQVPPDGKIAMVSAGLPAPQRCVRSEFLRLRGLAEIPPSVRGWAVDVLNVVRRLGKVEFSLKELYESEAMLKAAHPRNENIRPKIRQQLQVLRDLGLLEFSRRGHYVLRS